MNLGDLKAFVAVAEAGSVNRAAAKLNLTQPAVTRRVQSLEAAIGVALLDRSSKPPTLTEDGRRALAYGRKVLHAIDDLSSQVGAKGVLGGEFRLGIAPGLGRSSSWTTLGRGGAKVPECRSSHRRELVQRTAGAAAVGWARCRTRPSHRAPAGK